MKVLYFLKYYHSHLYSSLYSLSTNKHLSYQLLQTLPYYYITAEQNQPDFTDHTLIIIIIIVIALRVLWCCLKNLPVVQRAYRYIALIL